MRSVRAWMVIGLLACGVHAGTPDSPEPIQVLLPDAATTDGFGTVVATSEQFMIVGAPEHGDDSGGFAIYALQDGIWVNQHSSTPSDYATDEQAGFAVSISDNGMALVGVPGRGDGVVECWHQTKPGSWTRVQTIEAAAGNRFGAAIAMNGPTMIVGAPLGQGWAFVYQVVGGLTAPWVFVDGVQLDDGIPSSNFGRALAITGDRFFITAPGHLGGRAFFYQLIDGDLVLQQDMSTELPWQAGGIGTSITAHDDYVFFTSPDVPIGDSVGAVWGLVYNKFGDPDEKPRYVMFVYLGAPAGKGDTSFGAGLCVHNGHLAIGSPGHDNNAGLLEVYSIEMIESDGTWQYWIRETGLAWGEPGAEFGAAVALNTVGMSIGAPGTSEGAGSVQCFEHFEADDVPKNEAPPLVQASVHAISPDGAQAMAIELDGNLAVAGYPNAYDGDGAIVLLANKGDSWLALDQVQGQAGERLGFSVDLIGSLVAAGGPDASGGIGLVRTWTVSAENTLVPAAVLSPFAHAQAHTGFDIDLLESVAGDAYLAIGAPGMTTSDDVVLTYGALAIYRQLDGQSQWTLMIDMTSPMTGQHGTGYAVAMAEYAPEGIFALIGAPEYEWSPESENAGIVHVVAGGADGDTWTFAYQIAGNEPGGKLGSSLDANETMSIIGIPGSTESAPSGSALIINRIGNEDSYSQLLTADTGSPLNWGFGTSVAISQDVGGWWAAIGLPGYSTFRAPDSGAVDLYLHWDEIVDGLDFRRQSRTIALDAVDIDDLGGRVAIDGSKLLFTNAPTGNSAPPPVIASAQIQATANWTSELGGSYSNPENWSLPLSQTDTIRFSLLTADPYPVSYDDMLDAHPMHIDVQFDSPILVLDAISQALDMLSLTVASNPLIRGANVVIGIGTLHLSGDSAIGDDDAGSTGRFELHQSSVLQIDGHHAQATNSAMLTAIGVGTPDGHAFLEAQTIALGGGLDVWIEPQAAKQLVVGSRFIVARTQTTPNEGEDRFDVAVLPALPDDKAFQVMYGAPVERGGTWAWEAAIEVISLSGLLGFDDPNAVPVSGTPIAIELVDLTGDGADDICVLFDGLPGQLAIFENDGSGGVAQQFVLNTNNDPTSLAQGDFDADGRNDLAIGHMDGSIEALFNDNNDVTDGFAVQSLWAMGPVTCLCGINYDFIDGEDLIAGIEDLNGDGNGHLQWWLGQTALIGGGLGGGGNEDVPGVPIVIDPTEEEGQKDFVGVALLRSGNAAPLKSGALGATQLVTDLYVVGANPGGLEIADIDGDGHLDIAATSISNSALALLLGDGTPGDFLSPIMLPLGTGPTAIEAGDLNHDGHVDLAAVTLNASGVKVVRVLQNDGSLNFISIDTAHGENPTLLALGDVDGDGLAQLVSIGTGPPLRGGGLGEGLLSLRDVTVEACPGDTDGNGTVNIEDLLNVISDWGGDCSEAACQGDADGNGIVDIEDLLVVIGNYGPC